MKVERQFRNLRAVGLIALAIGAAGSVALMLYAGRHNPSRILLLLFTIWVLAPFAFLMLANLFAKKYSAFVRVALYIMTLFLALGTLIVYTYRVVSPPKTTGAFLFIVVPPISFLLIVIGLSTVAIIARR